MLSAVELNVIDDCNKELLAMGIDLSLPAGGVLPRLNCIVAGRGKPKAIRCDNGPEYVSASVRPRAEEHGSGSNSFSRESPNSMRLWGDSIVRSDT
jgi:hypothetical protein